MKDGNISTYLEMQIYAVRIQTY